MGSRVRERVWTVGPQDPFGLSFFARAVGEDMVVRAAALVQDACQVQPHELGT